jgi:uncharacterized membrane protein
MLGALYAVISAATFAFNNASLRRGVITSTVFQALAVTVPIGVPLFFIAALATGQLGKITDFSNLTFACLALAGIMHFVWGRYCGYRAIKAMGSNLVAPVQSANLIVALTLAIIVLGEKVTVLKVAGLVLIMLGNIIAIPPRKGKKKTKAAAKKAEAVATNEAASGAGAAGDSNGTEKPPAFVPNLTEGYTWALLSATGYGLSPVLVRFGLEGQGGATMAGGLISYVAATLFFSLLLIPKGRVRNVRTMDRKALPWFLNSGFFVFLAQMFRYLALSIAPVTVVTPIQRITGIFRILFSSLLNPGHEVINMRLIVGTVVSIAGAMALAVSIDMVAEFINLPPGVIDWRWP